MTAKLIILSSLLIWLSACSTKQTYINIQSDNARECSKIAHDTARDECLRGSNLPYKDYNREREKLLRQESSK